MVLRGRVAQGEVFPSAAGSAQKEGEAGFGFGHGAAFGMGAETFILGLIGLSEEAGVGGAGFYLPVQRRGITGAGAGCDKLDHAGAVFGGDIGLGGVGCPLVFEECVEASCAGGEKAGRIFGGEAGFERSGLPCGEGKEECCEECSQAAHDVNFAPEIPLKKRAK